MAEYRAPMMAPVGVAPAAPSKLTATRILIGVLALLVAGTATYLYWMGRPQGYTFTDSSAGMAVTIQFRTEVSDVAIEWPDGRDPTPPFGLYARGPDGAATPSAAVTFMLNASDLAQGTTRFRLRYRAYGVPRTADVAFDAKAERIRFVRGILDGMPNAWIQTTRSSPGRVFFSSLLSFKYALQEVRWGFDDEPLDRRLKFSPSDSLAAGIGNEDELYADEPPGAARVRIQLVYKDGVESATRAIRLEDAAH